VAHLLVPGTVAVDDIPSLVGGIIEVTFSVGDELKHLFERSTLLDQVYGDELAWEHDLVEGFHLLSLLDALTHPFLQLSPEQWTSWNYGLDRVRFLRPVRTTDSLRLRAEITEVRAKESATS